MAALRAAIVLPDMSCRSLTVLCALLWSLPAAAEVQWLEVNTGHFRVVTDGSERQLRQTAAQLERMQAVFATLLPHAADDPGSSTVVIALRSQGAFQALEPPAYLAPNALELAGYFLRGDDRNYLLLHLDSGGDHPYGTIYHEYTHYMVRHASSLPLWLNEGLAQFYQYTQIGKDDARLGQADPQAILFLRQASLLPLSVLFQVDNTSPYYHEEDAGTVFYAESWALTHFLMLADAGKPNNRLRTYMDLLHSGASSLSAAEQAFGDLNVLQENFERYLRANDFRQVLLKLDGEDDAARFPVTPLSMPEANALRADVLTRNGRLPEAEALVQDVLARTPASLQAHESLGLLRLKEHNLSAARTAFAEAVALHSANFLAWYYAGALTLHEGLEDTFSVPASLREALRLNPGYAPACDALTQFDVAHGVDLDEALQLSTRAVELDPANVQYRMDAAEVRVARHEVSSAAAVLQEALPLAADPEQASNVEARLGEIRSYQAQAERVRASRLEAGGGEAAPR